MVGNVLGELDPAAGPRLDRESNLAEVLFMDNLAGVPERRLQRGFSGTCQGQAALISRMAQHNATVFRIAASRMEHPSCKGSRLAWVIAVYRRIRFFRRHLRRDHDEGSRIEKR